MPVFNYKGIDASGNDTKGIVDAENIKSARSKLRKTGVYPTDLVLGGEEKISLSGDINLKAKFERVSAQDLAMITRQMSTLIQAGIPMVDTLVALTDQCENIKLKMALTSIREKVTGGSGLAEAMIDHRNIFSDLYINMIRAGESSGALDLVLNRLADFTESQAELNSKVSSAMIYPLILLSVCGIVLVVIFTAVIPRITSLFTQAKLTLPLITRILIGISDIFQTYWYLLIVFAILFAFAFKRYKETDQGALALDKLSLNLPIFGKMLRMVAVSRFSRTLSTLLKGGVPMLKAIDIVATVVSNRQVSQVIDQTRDYVKEGQSLAEPLKRSKIFPPMVTHMIAIGEKTGELESMLERVADAYDSQVNNMVNTLTSLLEPILILSMGIVVLIIVLSVLLPMLQMSQIA